MTVSSRQTTIVDASVAVKWVCEEEGSDRAAFLLEGHLLAAPSFWLVEVANALWRRAQRGELTREAVEERVAALSAAPVRTLDLQDLVRDAIKFACDLGHPVYDCLYLAAAVRCQGRVVTADKRFHAAASQHSVFGPMVTLL